MLLVTPFTTMHQRFHYAHFNILFLLSCFIFYFKLHFFIFFLIYQKKDNALTMQFEIHSHSIIHFSSYISQLHYKHTYSIIGYRHHRAYGICINYKFQMSEQHTLSINFPFSKITHHIILYTKQMSRVLSIMILF